MTASKLERLAAIFERLTNAAPASSQAEAKELLARVIEEVEEEMTEIENDPSHWQTDGRMYPIQEDNWRSETNGIIRGRSRAHNVFIGPNGAIEISEVGGATILTKLGADGQGVR